MSDHIPRPEIISGDAIYLTTLRREDLPLFVRWFNNLELSAYLGSAGFAATVEDEEAWYKQNAQRMDHLVTFSIIERERQQPIGSISLMDINHRHNIATLGIAIGDPTTWGKGYGTEAVRLMVEYGFYFLNLHNITLRLASFNERGYRAYLKAGFREAGRLRGQYVLGGVRYDEVLMDIIRDDVDLSRMRAMMPLIRVLPER